MEKFVPENIRKRILQLNGRGLTIYYIGTRLDVSPYVVKKIIEDDIRKDCLWGF